MSLIRVAKGPSDKFYCLYDHTREIPNSKTVEIDDKVLNVIKNGTLIEVEEILKGLYNIEN